MMIGYAHASPKGENLKQQRAVLGAAGCAQIFEEDDSIAQPDRPELTRMLDHLRAGDVVTVTRLDRLARSRPDLLAIAVRIKQADAGLRSLVEIWADTTTQDGSELLTVLAGIVEFEGGLIAERTSAGRIAAKAQGVKFGRVPTLSVQQIEHARQLIDEDNKSVAEVAQSLGVHRATLYRALGKPMWTPHLGECSRTNFIMRPGGTGRATVHRWVRLWCRKDWQVTSCWSFSAACQIRLLLVCFCMKASLRPIKIWLL